MEDILIAAGDGDDDLESLETARDSERPSNMEDILKAASDGDLESLEKVEAMNPGTVAAARDSQRRTALHLAASEGNRLVCEYLVARLRVFIDPRDTYGETPLHKATEQGHVGIVRFLLKNGANPNSKSTMGVTTLHNAASIGNLELVTMLIDKGLELNSRSFMETPLACAIKSGSADCFKALIQAGAAPQFIMDPLHAAAKSGSVEIVGWFLKAGRDPNACNSIGLKPIQVAEQYNNLDVVQLLHQWTTLGHASAKDAAPQRSQFVQMGKDALSDEEIDQKLAEMLLKDECVFFEGWSPMKKRLFYQSVFVQPTELKILGHGSAEIRNSVIFDMTNKYKAQSSYLRAIQHYQAWQFCGSELIYEIGPHRKRFCASRKDQTFIFWFRYLVQDVGLVIDGQALWAEGMLRRTRGTDGSYTYASPIQFRNAPKDVSSSSKQKAPMETPYIVHRELLEADYGGRYAGKVSNMKFSLSTTRSAVVAISSHDKNKSLHLRCHPACDNLVFFAPEAGKNSWIFQYTMHSLDPSLEHPISVPSDFDGTVTNHQQVSEKVLSALKAISGKKLKDVPGCGYYEIVEGTVFRSLWQCLNAYIILRRERAFKTKFFLKGMEQEYGRQVKIKPQRQRHESDQEFEERVREENVKTGTRFDPILHSGMGHRIIDGPMPLKPSRKRWYHKDEPRYVYKYVPH